MYTPPDNGTRTATFKVSREDYEQLERQAREEDRSVSAVLRLALRNYLDKARAEAAA